MFDVVSDVFRDDRIGAVPIAPLHQTRLLVQKRCANVGLTVSQLAVSTIADCLGEFIVFISSPESEMSSHLSWVDIQTNLYNYGFREFIEPINDSLQHVPQHRLNRVHYRTTEEA